MVGDELEYEKIGKMTVLELLEYVTGNPHLLSDSYYRGYDTAIYARREQLKNVPVHVVMGNDFPAAVFSTEALAEAYCERMRAVDADPRGPQPRRRIHWRHYEFKLDKDKEK